MSEAAPPRKPRLLDALIAGAVLGIFIAEQLRPNRPRAPGQLRRLARNVVMGALSGAVIQLIERPLVERALAPTQSPMRRAAAFLSMDYSFYVWHVLTHKAPLLWRFHVVHHAERDMAMTTAMRFHLIDMLISIPWRVGQVALFRVDRATFELWQRFFLVSILLHHSNIRLGPGAERILSWLLTTPGMHDIHHRATRDCTDSNWSSGIAIWDRLHRTYRAFEPAPPVRIGLPAWPETPGVERSLRLPFQPQCDDWRPA